MAQIQTYPRKSFYNGNDLFLVADKTPNAQGEITNETKSVTLSTVVAAAITESTPIALNLTTQGTSGAANFDAVTSTLNIPVYTADTNTTYDLTAPSAGVIRLTGSDTTTDDVSVSGSGGITITQGAANNINIDGSGISGGVAQVTAASPAASVGTPLIVTPTSGNVTVQSRAYDGGNNVGHVPTGGTSTTFLRGDGNFSTVVTATPAFSPIPIALHQSSEPVDLQKTILNQFISTVRMAPTKIILYFPTANNEDISIAIYKGTIDPKDGTLFASIVNANVGSTAGQKQFTLQKASGAGNDIEVGESIILVLSFKGGSGGDTMGIISGTSDTKLGQMSNAQAYVSSAFPGNVSSFSTSFAAYRGRPAFVLY